MADLATVADLEARLGRTLTAQETTQANALLRDASATVRAYTGRQFARITETVRLPVIRGVVTLPGRPVVSIDAVTDTDGLALSHLWVSGGNVAFPGYDYVDVTYTHGDTVVPDAIVAVVCSIARRALEVPDAASGLTQETIGSYSYSVGSVAASGGAGLLNAEKAVLDRFTRVGGVAWMSR